MTWDYTSREIAETDWAEMLSELTPEERADLYRRIEAERERAEKERWFDRAFKELQDNLAA